MQSCTKPWPEPACQCRQYNSCIPRHGICVPFTCNGSGIPSRRPRPACRLIALTTEAPVVGTGVQTWHNHGGRTAHKGPMCLRAAVLPVVRQRHSSQTNCPIDRSACRRLHLAFERAVIAQPLPFQLKWPRHHAGRLLQCLIAGSKSTGQRCSQVCPLAGPPLLLPCFVVGGAGGCPTSSGDLFSASVRRAGLSCCFIGQVDAGLLAVTCFATVFVA